MLLGERPPEPDATRIWPHELRRVCMAKELKVALPVEIHSALYGQASCSLRVLRRNRWAHGRECARPNHRLRASQAAPDRGSGLPAGGNPHRRRRPRPRRPNPPDSPARAHEWARWVSETGRLSALPGDTLGKRRTSAGLDRGRDDGAPGRSGRAVWRRVRSTLNGFGEGVPRCVGPGSAPTGGMVRRSERGRAGGPTTASFANGYRSREPERRTRCRPWWPSPGHGTTVRPSYCSPTPTAPPLDRREAVRLDFRGVAYFAYSAFDARSGHRRPWRSRRARAPRAVGD